MNARLPILLVALALWLLCCGKNPAEPLDEYDYSDQIAFFAGEALYVMNLDTDSTWQVTEAVWPGGLRWSPDGERIAYTGPFDYYEAYQIYVVNADGSRKRLVTLWEIDGRIEPHLDGGMVPVWSPDGDRIAFTRCINCEVGGLNTEIFIIELDTTDGIKEIKLTDNPYSDSASDWSPDGEKILFQSDYSLDSTFDHYGDWYTMNVDGSDKQRIMTNDTTFFGRHFRYSPDGQLIAFIGGINKNEIYIMNADGSDIQRITNNTVTEHFLSWSPDGTRLVFMVGSLHDGGHIYIINIDGTDLTQITTGEAQYFTPEWRPYRKL